MLLFLINLLDNSLQGINFLFCCYLFFIAFLAKHKKIRGTPCKNGGHIKGQRLPSSQHTAAFAHLAAAAAASCGLCPWQLAKGRSLGPRLF
jgi:hypothetical protein